MRSTSWLGLMALVSSLVAAGCGYEEKVPLSGEQSPSSAEAVDAKQPKARMCAGTVDYYEWQCVGKTWQKVWVGQRDFKCSGQWRTVGKVTDCKVSNLTITCGGGDGCADDAYAVCPAAPTESCTASSPGGDPGGFGP